MKGHIKEIENKLYFINEDKSYILIKNVWKLADGYHQVSGWYIYPVPLSLNGKYEVDINNETCLLIKKIEV